MLLRTISSFRSFRQLSRVKSFSSGIKNESNFTKPISKTIPKQSPDSDAKKSEVLSRTRIVVDERECKKIVESLMKTGEPVAVDMEGNQLPVLGLIQIKTSSGQIYLFRTGRNKKLLFEGGLKDLFEDQNILKVMFAAANDCSSIYKEGVRMWGLYDACLAHSVIQFQNLGVSCLHSAVNFNKLCQIYGFPENPLKELMQGSMFQKENAFLDLEHLPENLAYYAACDVEPLLELYQITSSLISPDFWPLFNELCEQELIRCVDPELARIRRNVLKREESKDVFVTNVDNGATKAPIYEILANHEGNKKVLSSVPNCTAHLVMGNRQSAVLVYKSLNDKRILNKKIGEFSKVRLIRPLRLDEVEAAEIESEKSRDRLKEENYIVDCDKAKQIVQLIERVKCPVVMEFSVNAGNTNVELFVGRYPTIKFDVNPETVVQFGIGQLMASKDVTKIVGRVDTINANTVLGTCSSKDFRPNNFFDVSSAFKVVDFILYGSSIFKAATPTAKEMSYKLGIFAHSHLERYLYIYLHLKNYLPQELLNFLGAKSRIELDLSSNLFVSEAKEARKQLRLKYETRAVHIAAEQVKTSHPHSWPKVESMFESSLKTFLSEKKFEFSLLIVVGDRAIVSLNYHPDVDLFISEINSNRTLDGNLKLFASKVETKTTEREQPPTVNVVNLERQNLPNLDNLDDLGFFKLLEDDVTRTTRSFKDDSSTTNRNGDNSKPKFKSGVKRDFSKSTNRNETNKTKFTFANLTKLYER